MANTTAEHLKKGAQVISDQEAFSQAGQVISFGRVAKAYVGYQCELQHTRSEADRTRLREIADKAESALIEFLGSKKAVKEALVIWQKSQPKNR